MWNLNNFSQVFLLLFLSSFSFTRVTAQSEINDTCKSSWSDPTVCFDGSSLGIPDWKERRLVVIPAQIDGELCSEDILVNKVELLSCDDGEVKVQLPPSLNAIECSDFGLAKCDNGRCISESLLCNTEDDCGDNSDEQNCVPKSETLLYCGFSQDAGKTNVDPPYLERWLRSIPGINKFSTGFDMLTGTYKSAVLDMSAHGSCRKVLIEGGINEFYRIPANVVSFRQINSIVIDAAQLYASGSSLLTTLQSELRFNPERAGFVSELASRIGLSQQQQVKELVKNSAEDEHNVFVQQTVQVKTAEVTLQDAKYIIPSSEFVRRLMELPYTDMSYDKYLSFIEDFGTHYVSASNLGGVFKQIQEYSRCWLEYGDFEKFSKKDWREVLPNCARSSYLHSLNPDQASWSPDCTRSESGTISYIREQTVSNFLSTIGGSLETASDLKYTFNEANWKIWIESLKQNPSLTTQSFELKEITDLLQSDYIPMNSERRLGVTKLLKEAIQIYFGAYDSKSLCLPCEKEADYFSESEVGVPYVTGTGVDYKCYCTYDSTPSEYTCGSSSLKGGLICLWIGLLLSIKSIFNY